MGIKISALPAVATPSSSDIFPIVQSGVTYKETVAQLSTVIGIDSPLTVPQGGTGNTTFTPYSVICAGTTATGAFQNVVGVGSANQVLVSNGAANLPSWQAVPSLTLGGLKSFQVFISGSAQTYTKPVGITSILVEVLGGGGAGGGATSVDPAHDGTGGGGGAGGYARLWVASAASTYTYTVGAAGTPGAAGNNPGGNGGTTSFSASSLQATGGAGGQGGASTSAAAALTCLGGTGGVGSNGNINAKGQSGVGGINSLGAALSGAGGSSIYGGGGDALISSSDGVPSGNYGSGGGGAVAQNSSQAGGAGSAGIIIVWEFS